MKTFSLSLISLTLGVPWLHAAVTIGTPFALPSALAVNTPTLVLATIPIPDSTLIAGSVNLLRLSQAGQSPIILGQLHDDGLNGDAVAGDKIYSLQVTLNEPTPTTIRLQTSAAFRGLLQRVFSPVLNVVVTTSGIPTLPPDPGPAGMLTLMGIDSDGDGVRDDVQRFIALTYTSSAKLQAASTQLAKAFLTQVVDSTNSSLSPADILSGLYAVDCLFYISPNTASQVLTQLQSQVLNTVDRLNAYAAGTVSINTQSYQLPTQQRRGTRCAVDPNTLPN